MQISTESKAFQVSQCEPTDTKQNLKVQIRKHSTQDHDSPRDGPHNHLVTTGLRNKTSKCLLEVGKAPSHVTLQTRSLSCRETVKSATKSATSCSILLATKAISGSFLVQQLQS